MKSDLKTPVLCLIWVLCLAACSPLPRTNSGPTSFASTGLASSVNQEAITATALFEKQPDRWVTLAGSQDLPGNQPLAAIDAVAPNATDSLVLVQEIHDLAAQRRADLVPSEPGWLHLIIRSVQAQADASSAWDNSSGQRQLEQWLSLDEQGRVRADIRRVLDNPGQAGDFYLLSGGDWTNLPLAGFSAASSTLPFDPTYGIYELVTQLVGQGQILNKSILYKECWYQGEKYTLSDGQVIHEIVFMPDNHALRWVKTWQISSGSIVLVDSFEIALEERLPQPPADILALVGPAALP